MRKERTSTSFPEFSPSFLGGNGKTKPAQRLNPDSLSSGSVDALVDGGHPGGQEFDLRVGQVAVLGTEIAQRRVR